MGNIKKIQNHVYHFKEENREEMDVENPKRCNEDRNCLHPNKQARDIITDVTVINQVNIGSDHRMFMSNIKLDVDVERKNNDPEATKSRCHKIGQKRNSNSN